MSELSKLKVWIGADTDDLEKGLKEGEQEVKKFGSDVQRTWQRVAKVVRNMKVVGPGTDGFAELQRDLSRLWEEMEAMERKMKELKRAAEAAQAPLQKPVQQSARSFDTLGLSVQQVVRELPSLSMGFGQFFLAISNNVPMLVDELNRAKVANAALVKSGEKGVPVWKQLGRSIFSWQSALVVGITLLSAYGREIVEWVGGLFSSERALGAAAAAQRRLNEASRAGIANAQEELLRLGLLRREAEQGGGMDARLRAVDELQRLYPGYLGNIERERVLSGDVGDAYVLLAANIERAAVAKARFDKLLEAAKEAEALRGAYEDAMKEGQEAMERYGAKTIEDVRKVYAGIEAETRGMMEGGNGPGVMFSLFSRWFGDKGDIVEIVDAYDALIAKQEEVRRIAEGVDVGGLLDSGGAGGGTERVRTLEEVVVQEERTLDAIKEKMGAMERLKAATDVADQAGLDYYNKEIARLTVLAQKVDELSQKRVTDAMKAEVGGPVEVRDVYGGLEDAVKDIGENTAAGLDFSLAEGGLSSFAGDLEETKGVVADFSSVLQSSFSDLAVGFGESIGQLLAGGGSVKGFAALVGGTFADMAINVGKTAIKLGTTMIGIKAALTPPFKPFAAIAAGVALVALGTALKSTMADIANGGSTFSGNMGNTIDVGSTGFGGVQDLEHAPLKVEVSGELKARGSSLVAALESEEKRRGLVR